MLTTVLVSFGIPSDKTTEEVIEKFRGGAHKWREREGLIRKYYLVSPDGRGIVGVYHWRSREDAEAVFETGFREGIEKGYGSLPEITYYDTPIVVDNELGRVQFDGAAAPA